MNRSLGNKKPLVDTDNFLISTILYTNVRLNAQMSEVENV